MAATGRQRWHEQETSKVATAWVTMRVNNDTSSKKHPRYGSKGDKMGATVARARNIQGGSSNGDKMARARNTQGGSSNCDKMRVSKSTSSNGDKRREQ